MNVLISTLKEELVTVKRLERKYLKELKTLPHGGFVVRTVRGKKYGYLTYRDGPSVKQKYIGRMDEKEINSYRKTIAKRNDYKKKLRSVREQKKILMRALREKAK